MSTNTTKAAVEAVPFFARFLEEQADRPDTPSFGNTLKYPSDLEEF